MKIEALAQNAAVKALEMPQVELLDQQLKVLQNDADTQFEQYRRSHDALYQLLAKSYLWWREASQQQGYLESLYKQRDIGFIPTKDNKPNFNPLIRLIWNFNDPDQSDRVTISQWAKVLKAMDEHFREKGADLEHNADGELVAFIKQTRHQGRGDPQRW